MDKKTDKSYFDQLYKANNDPWNFSGSDYERLKYERTLAAVSGKRYRNTLEIGCSIGVFTELLAPFCDLLTAMDISEIPLESARKRLRDQEHVKFVRASVPAGFPAGDYDLIILSEVGYYLTENELLATKELTMRHLQNDGLCCLVHWRPKIKECDLTGDQVHALFADERWTPLHHEVNEQYRIDVLQRP